MDNSKIEWTTHTFNPWHGCMKVSEGCKFCYAETMDNRWNGGHWGPNSPRKAMSEAYWQKPLNWNRAAQRAGKQARVFCASMADVFEDHMQVKEHRIRLFSLIEKTPHLIWQLLTKRPENIMYMVPETWKIRFPENVWIGTSVENQEAANKRIPHLLRVPAEVRFLSCEPLLGPLDLTEYMTLTDANSWGTELAEQRGWGYNDWSGGFEGPGSIDSCYDPRSGINWVIAGGESGHHARPLHPDWIRSLRNQSKDAEIPFFFKQWGEYIPSYDAGERSNEIGRYDNPIGDCWVKFGHKFQDGITVVKVGKKSAGRILDGREYNQFPDYKIDIY